MCLKFDASEVEPDSACRLGSGQLIFQTGQTAGSWAWLLPKRQLGRQQQDGHRKRERRRVYQPSCA
jgi:hypothetical protein